MEAELGPPTAGLSVGLLGSFRATWAGEPIGGLNQARLQSLLAYLLLHPGVPLSRQQLAFIFWPDTSEEQARSNLRTLLHRLRDVLPDSACFLAPDRHTVQWRGAAGCTVDVAAFEAALAVAAAAGRDSVAAADALAAAVGWYAGDLLPACYDDWILPIRERLRQAYLRALDQLVLLYERERAYGSAIGYAQQLAREDLLREATCRHLMRLHLAVGDRASALSVYHASATLLRRELGVDPGAETQALYQQVLFTDQAITPRPAQTPDPPALVGRAAEWAQLQGLWRRAAAGHPHLALLIGETGVGKSRLAEELLELAKRRQQLTAQAHCTPGDRALAYAPVAALLRTPALAPRLARLQAAWLTELSRLLPELAMAHPGLAAPGPMTKPWQRQRLFQALTQALLPSDAAPAVPLLVLLDDMQWCDRDTLDWLLHLLEHAEAAPLLVLATACCCELTSDNPVDSLFLHLQRRDLATRIELDPLPPAAVAELAAATLGRSLSPAELAYLVREAEGNPLFAIEMARAGLDAADQGGEALTTRPGAVRHPGEDPLPPKVEAALRRRLGELSPAARDLAQVAAVIGRTFTAEALAGISGLGEDALLRGLDELWRRRIIRERAAADYDFSHDKLRAVAYAMLSPMRRRQLHLRAAEALSAAAGGGTAAQMARHLLAAGDERRALAYLLQAADHARVIYAHSEAIAHYERAVALQRRLDTPQATARTLMKLGLTYHHTFDYARARAAYEAGFDLWQHVGDTAAGLPAAGGQTLRSHWGSLTTLDPGLVGDFNTVAIVEELFDGLADHGPDAEVIPALAADWDVEEGGRRYIFHLREGLRWSDGVALTAHDFEAGWRRVLHPATQASCANFLYDVLGARAYHSGETADEGAVGVRALDDRTFMVELERPTGYFPHLLANPVTYPIPRHALAEHGEAWTQPGHIVSNGPFVLAEWQRGAHLALNRNPRYHGAFGGNIARVELALEQDAQAVLAAYEADELDVVQLDYRFSLAERETLRERHTADLASAPRFTTWFLGFDTGQPPLDDPRVRRALALAVDREVMAGAALRGFATPATGGLTPPGIPGHVPDIALPYNPAAGRRLLAEAGFPDGRGFPALTFVCEQTVSDQAAFLQAQWRTRLGVAVTIEEVDWPTFVRRMEGERLPIYYSAWRADYPDPDNFLRVALQWRKTRWDDAGFAALVERARGLADPHGRLAVYAEAERRLIEAAAIVPLNYRRAYFLLKPRIVRYPTSGLRPWFWQDVLIKPV